MRIRTQFMASTVIFSTVLLIVAASVILTNQQIAWLDQQQNISGNIEKDSDLLNTLLSQYFLYQQNQQITSWNANSDSILGNLSDLHPTNSEQKALVNKAIDDLGLLKAGFNEVISYLESAPRNVSVRILPEFQNVWNLTVSEHQTFGLDASQISESLRFQADQFRMTNTVLIVALLGIFGTFLLVNYLITYRRTLKSISNLQAGINIIGSGNLDFKLKETRKDETSELSHAFNQMTINLKTVTASKAELENEIIERKKAEEALSKLNEELEERVRKRTEEVSSERQRLYNVLETLPAYVVLLDKDYCVPFANKVFRERFGESQGRCCYDFLFNRESPCENCETYKVLKTNGPHHWEWTGPDNHDYDIYDFPFVEADGSNLILEMGIDITERKKAEALAQENAKKLKDAERLAAIGATAGMVGHDIRNPLQAITSDVYLAKTELASISESEEKSNVQESLSEIEKNISYINKIVADLQDFARPLSPKIEEIDFEHTVHSVLARLNIPGNVTVKHSVRKDFPKLMTDQSYLERIITNLANNAIQAMPKGGKLNISAVAKNGRAMISVEDNGEGIPEEVRGKMFTPLVTTKSKGQGFGLSVVKRFTEALGGIVTFESEAGKGTKFTIELPV